MATKPNLSPKRKLSCNKDHHAPPSMDSNEDTKKPVKSKELDKLCEIFGDTGGVKAFQDGVDVDEARQWQALNEKYAPFLPSQDRAGDKDNEDGKKEKPRPKSKGDEELATKLEKLTDKIEKTLNAQISQLKAMIPLHASQDEPKRSSIDRYASRYK